MSNHVHVSRLFFMVQVGDLSNLKMHVNSQNVNKFIFKNLTLLQQAAISGQAEIASYLISIGANLETDDNTPLQLASSLLHSEVFQILVLSGAKINLPVDSPLRILISIGEQALELIDFLFQNGADVNYRDKFLHTPLFYAIDYSDIKILKYLISKGADIETVDLDCLTPLHYAVAHNHLEPTKYLLFYGANPNTRSLHSSTPLFRAIGSGNLEIVRHLVDNGADIEATIEQTNSNKITPLCFAIMNHCTPIIKYLISAGANIERFDSTLLSPINYALKYKNMEAVNILIQKGVLFINPLCPIPLLKLIHSPNNVNVLKLLCKYEYKHYLFNELYVDDLDTLILINELYNYMSSPHDYDSEKIIQVLFKLLSLHESNNASRVLLGLKLLAQDQTAIVAFLIHFLKYSTTLRFSDPSQYLLPMMFLMGNEFINSYLMDPRNEYHLDGSFFLEYPQNALKSLYDPEKFIYLPFMNIDFVKKTLPIFAKNFYDFWYHPFILGCCHSEEDLKLVSENEINITGAALNGTTALHRAAKYNNIAVTKQLIQWILNPFRLNNRNEMPIDIANRLGHMEIVDLLSQYMEDISF